MHARPALPIQQVTGGDWEEALPPPAAITMTSGPVSGVMALGRGAFTDHSLTIRRTVYSPDGC